MVAFFYSFKMLHFVLALVGQAWSGTESRNKSAKIAKRRTMKWQIMKAPNYILWVDTQSSGPDYWGDTRSI